MKRRASVEVGDHREHETDAATEHDNAEQHTQKTTLSPNGHARRRRHNDTAVQRRREAPSAATAFYPALRRSIWVNGTIAFENGGDKSRE